MTHAGTRDDAWPVGTFMAQLAAASAADLLHIGTGQRVAAGRVLLREGDTDSHLIVVQHGITKVTAGTADGRSALLSIRIAGDLLGEMSALSEQPRSATATMCSPGVVRFIHRRDFMPFLATHTDAAIALSNAIADQLRRANRRRIDFNSYPVKVRLARVIAELAQQHGATADHGGVEIAVRITQPELATMCGAAEISVQKAWRDMRRANVVSSRYGRITVWNLRELRGHADM